MSIPFSYNLRNLWVRKTGTALTVVGVGFVVWIFVMVMAVASGLQSKMSQTGEPDNILILTKEAQFEFSSVIQPQDRQVLNTYDEFEKDERGRPLISVETLFGAQQPKGVEPSFLFVRGIDAEQGVNVHSHLQRVTGRMFQPLARELVVSQTLAEKYPSLGMGRTVKIGRHEWTVVGLFHAGGGAFDSIVYTDRMDLRTNLKMNRDFSVTAKVKPEAMKLLMAKLEQEKRVSLRAKPERVYYAEQGRTAKQMEALAYMVSAIMAVGAVFGAINTMYAAVAGRSREIGTLRALGFPKRSIMIAFMTECVLIAVMGGVMGCALGLATAGVSFELPEQGIGLMKVHAAPTWQILTGGLSFGVVMGVLGGFFPARAASRLEIVTALRKI